MIMSLMVAKVKAGVEPDSPQWQEGWEFGQRFFKEAGVKHLFSAFDDKTRTQYIVSIWDSEDDLAKLRNDSRYRPMSDQTAEKLWEGPPQIMAMPTTGF